MRIFVALDLPDDMVAALSRLQDRLTTGHHVPEEDLHLTLAFVPDIRIPALDDLALDLEMMQAAPPPLRIAGIGTFGTAKPRSLHAQVAPVPALVHLQGRVATLIRRAGISLPRARFVPHITLARFPATMAEENLARVGRFLQAHGDWSHETTVPETMTLYQSTLTEDGPRYDPLLTCPLG